MSYMSDMIVFYFPLHSVTSFQSALGLLIPEIIH